MYNNAINIRVYINKNTIKKIAELSSVIKRITNIGIQRIIITIKDNKPSINVIKNNFNPFLENPLKISFMLFLLFTTTI